MLLAALAFVSCNKDENKEDQVDPAIVALDYSSLIDMSYANMIKTLGEPTLGFGSFYSYEEPKANISSITTAINPETNSVYLAMVILKENAFKAEDLQKYFASKFTSYGLDEEEGAYFYGNAEKQEDATLVIGVYENSSITFTNPKNVPEINESGSIEGTPVEVTNALLGKSIDDLIDEYGDAIIKYGDAYMVNYEDDDYLMCVSLIVEEGIVRRLIILYNEDLDDQAIIDYYTSEGYTCLPTGNVNEEGKAEYLFMNLTTGIAITYLDTIGVVVEMEQHGDDDEGGED